MAKVSYIESQIESWVFDYNSRLNTPKDNLRLLIDDVSWLIVSKSESFSAGRETPGWRNQVGEIFGIAVFRASWLGSPCVQALFSGLPLDFDFQP